MKKQNKLFRLKQKKSKQQSGSPLRRTAVLLFWLFFWEFAARQIDNTILLVSPSQTLLALCKLAGQTAFWTSILHSFLRISTGFLLALMIGSLLAILSYLCPLIQEILSPPIRLMKSIPVASFIILALLWVSSRNLSVLISFLMVLPIIYTNLLTGIKQTNEQLLEMAQVYHVSPLRRFRYIYLPAVLPYLQSACSVGLGFCFKSGIAAEVIGLPVGSIGEKLYEAKLYLMTPELFAWTFVIVGISFLLEYLIMALIRFLVRLLTAPTIQRRGKQETKSILSVTSEFLTTSSEHTELTLNAFSLSVQHLYRQYGDQKVLSDFSCDITPGSCTAIMGPSGSGKTTLLRIIAGLEQPDSGTIHIAKANTNISEYTVRISMVFQENRLCPDFDAITNIRLVLPFLSPDQIRSEFAKVTLTDYEGKPVRTLSGGMQRRVAIVRAVLTARCIVTSNTYNTDSTLAAPSVFPLVLLDEPLKGLDPELYLTVREYIRSSLSDITTILVTHSPDEANYFTKEILNL